MRPAPLPVPQVTHVYAEGRLVYKLVKMKNKLAASYESILIKLDNLTFSQLGFNKFVTNIMLESYTSDNQFGFKSSHSTDLCIYTLKEFIDYYKSRGTTVYITFLDANKAFDRIDHWLLFNKIIKKGVPLFIIKLLVFWYSRQRMFVRWGNTCSTSFCVTNGVKQGGIISLMLFNLYMDELSLKLNCSGIGGNIGTFFINHLCYANDNSVSY